MRLLAPGASERLGTSEQLRFRAPVMALTDRSRKQSIAQGTDPVAADSGQA
jgi:hypothetical protein